MAIIRGRWGAAPLSAQAARVEEKRGKGGAALCGCTLQLLWRAGHGGPASCRCTASSGDEQDKANLPAPDSPCSSGDEQGKAGPAPGPMHPPAAMTSRARRELRPADAPSSPVASSILPAQRGMLALGDICSVRSLLRLRRTGVDGCGAILRRAFNYLEYWQCDNKSNPLSLHIQHQIAPMQVSCNGAMTAPILATQTRGAPPRWSRRSRHRRAGPTRSPPQTPPGQSTHLHQASRGKRR